MRIQRHPANHKVNMMVSYKFDEDALEGLLPYCVDVGASFPDKWSQSYDIIHRHKWQALLIEADQKKYERIVKYYGAYDAVRTDGRKVHPDSICDVLAEHGVPRDFGFLNLDIDGYDYWILDAILSQYRPGLVCSEINQYIPPPVCFTVKYDPDYWWDVSDFFGYSIQMLRVLCEKHAYKINWLDCNNVFLMPVELPGHDMTPAEAYRDGNVRFLKGPHLISGILEQSPQEAMETVRAWYSPKYDGRYELYLDEG